MNEENKFVFPEIDFLLDRHSEDEKIVVVSIIGKSNINAKGLKLKTLGRMFTDPKNRNNYCTIEGYHDVSNQIIYLHVHSFLDSDNFMENYEKILEESEQEDGNSDFLGVYDKIKSAIAKTMFLLFYISHLVIVSHPGFTFDTNYIQYFKAVEAMDKNLIDEITAGLKEVGNIGEEWITAGRPATPRIIFYFDKCPKNLTNIKKFEHNLEDRIYQVLRKSRIIATNKSISLFAIPMNEEFVYVSDEKPEDFLGDAIRGLILGCQPGAVLQVQAPYCDRSENPRCFQSFLKRHIRQARNNGFDESSGHFELPTISQWVNASKVVNDVMTSQKLISELCTETRFSEQRCLKVLPIALARYQEGLPVRYTSAVHKTRLGFALVLFSAQARGPMFQKYSEQLIADCIAYWESGRQLCEFLSLKGNPCTMPIQHPDDQEHSSGVKYIAVCDCGRKQGSRDDPYNPKEGNHVFYHNLAKECGCSKNEHIVFPTFKPSTSEYKAAVIDEALKKAKAPKALDENQQEPKKKKVSTVEYLPGMLTLGSPPGLLPEYASWSLVCYGASSLYSHNIGLPESHQPGFWPNTNYLLPWDVLVYVKAQPTFDENGDGNKVVPNKKDTKQKWVPQFAVKVFVGFEYECPRGHRFMLAAPDKILKASPGCIVKDKGQKVAESDMPLYFPCLCGRGNMMAQLMRLHVVTPKAAVHVKVNPRVQPAPGAPIFVPSLDGPSTLTQAAYWILRFPYIYMSDKKNYLETQGAKLLAGLLSVKKIEYAKDKN